jgi:hypothetical protein
MRTDLEVQCLYSVKRRWLTFDGPVFVSENDRTGLKRDVIDVEKKVITAEREPRSREVLMVPVCRHDHHPVFDCYVVSGCIHRVQTDGWVEFQLVVTQRHQILMRSGGIDRLRT